MRTLLLPIENFKGNLKSNSGSHRSPNRAIKGFRYTSGSWEQFQSAILFLTALDRRNTCVFGGKVHKCGAVRPSTTSFL